MNRPDLAGLRVVVTRSEQQARPLIAAVEKAGGKPIALPLLAIVDAADGGVALRSALETLGSDDWLAVLSPNAAHRVVDAGRGAFSLAVVGEGTAKVFAQTGWIPEIVSAEESAAGLLAEFPPAGGGRVVIAQAASGRPTLADGLRSVGWQVEVVVAYQNLLPEVGDEAVEQARSAADVVVFASPSAVVRYVDLVGIVPSTAVCIGAATAETAATEGFNVAVAEAPTIDALVGELERACRRSPPPKP